MSQNKWWYKCQHCGIHFNSNVLDRCPDCKTKVGMVNPENLEAKEISK